MNIIPENYTQTRTIFLNQLKRYISNIVFTMNMAVDKV